MFHLSNEEKFNSIYWGPKQEKAIQLIQATVQSELVFWLYGAGVTVLSTVLHTIGMINKTFLTLKQENYRED